MKDIGAFGIKLKIGDFVSYPGRAGSDIWLRYGIITEINSKYVKVSRGVAYTTYCVKTDQCVSTDFFIRTMSIINNKLIVKIPYEETEFSNPNHNEYEILQKIWDRLKINTIELTDIIKSGESQDGC
jgi:hypothetical protein